MKKGLILAAFLSLFMFAGSTGAFEYKLGYDFGNPFDENNNYSPVYYPYHIQNYPSPGYLGEGGEKFDLEGIHFGISGDMVHVALVNSFGLAATSSAWHQTYNLGDIFFGFDGSSTSYAIDPFTRELYAVNSYDGIYNLPGSYYGNSYVRTTVGAYNVTSGTNLGTVNHEYTMWQGLETNPMQGNGDTWVMEFSFNRSLIDMAGMRTISFHNTLGCGNDLMNKTFTVVPEPGTLLMFGLGLLGSMVIHRKD